MAKIKIICTEEQKDNFILYGRHLHFEDGGSGRRKMRLGYKKLGYYIFAIKWLYKHKDWFDTRQKYKALNRDYQCYLKTKQECKEKRANRAK